MYKALTERCAGDVARVDDLSREEFESDYLRTGTPVVVTGGTKDWAAPRRWSFDLLRSACGAREVRVQFYPSANMCRFEEFRYCSMTLAEYIDRIRSDPDFSATHYLASEPPEEVLQEILGDIECPAIVAPRISWRRILFVGRDCFTQIHYHTASHSILAQITGEKSVVLFRPAQTAYLYPHPWHSQLPHFSRIDFDEPVTRRYPRFLRATAVGCVLRPGEMLYIPLHWWHAVHGHDENISVTTSWSAPMRDWHFPTPGLRILGNAVLRRVQRGIGKLGRSGARVLT